MAKFGEAAKAFNKELARKLAKGKPSKSPRYLTTPKQTDMLDDIVAKPKRKVYDIEKNDPEATSVIDRLFQKGAINDAKGVRQRKYNPRWEHMQARKRQGE